MNKIVTWLKKRITFISLLLIRLANSEIWSGVKKVFNNLNDCVGYFKNQVKMIDEKNVDLDTLRKYASQLHALIGEVSVALFLKISKEDMALKDNFEYCWIPEMIFIEFSNGVDQIFYFIVCALNYNQKLNNYNFSKIFMQLV